MAAVADIQNTLVKSFARDPRVEIVIMSQMEHQEILEEYWRNVYLRGEMIFDRTGEVSLNMYGLEATPTPFGRSFLIGRDQRVIQANHGYNPQATLDEINSLLKVIFGGTVSGLDIEEVECRNLGTAQSRSIWSGEDSWFCDVDTFVRDNVVQTLLGSADGVAPVAGTVTGMRLRTLVCENRTTARRVQARLTGTDWDCEELGLVVHPGDEIEVRATGTS